MVGGGTMDFEGREEEEGGVMGERGRVGGGRVVISVMRVTVLKHAKARRGELGEALEWSAISGLLELLWGTAAGTLPGAD